MPVNASDAAIYVSSGLLPVEAAVDKKTQNFFYSICILTEDSSEKQLARRQLAVKQIDSSSWFVQIKKILWKYSLPEAEELLQAPFRQSFWRGKVNWKLHNYWSSRILDKAELCRSLRHMNHAYHPGKLHPSLTIPFDSVRSCNRLPIKLKLLTGTYILQVNIVAFNQNEVDPTCRLCRSSEEKLEHFILICPMLESIRSACFPEIAHEVRQVFGLNFNTLSLVNRVSLVLDCTSYISDNVRQYHRRYNDKLKYLKGDIVYTEEMVSEPASDH